VPSSAAASRGRSISTRPTPGRCRKAASTRAKSRGRRRLGEIADWLQYDIPREIVGQAWKGKYRGQTQKWFAMRFTGDESEIDLAHPAGAAEPEFSAWRWEAMQNVPNLVVPFKRGVYERVVLEFAHLAGA
jgi:putative (di)nucleoside polyphosphate hydrolase